MMSFLSYGKASFLPSFNPDASEDLSFCVYIYTIANSQACKGLCKRLSQNISPLQCLTLLRRLSQYLNVGIQGSQVK